MTTFKEQSESMRHSEEAADKLESLQAEMKDIVIALREETDTEIAHAMVYQFRHKIGRVVASLDRGYGPPAVRAKKEAAKKLGLN